MKNYKLKRENYGLRLAKFFLTALFLGGLIISVRAQSINSEYPTPVTSNEISGTIRARDIGDARLTSYYYVFNGTQGDVFVNITANNFNGDINVFAADGLRPLSEIKLYADNSPTETGRIIYLRQPLKLILRVEGRTPDDNPATFEIKFAGSFAAMESSGEQSEPTAPKVESDEKGAVRVNSVGTIIEEKKVEKADQENKDIETAQTAEKPRLEKSTEKTKPKAIVTTDTKNESDNDSETKSETAVKKTKEPITRKRKSEKRKTVPPASSETTPDTKSPPVNSLENIRLVILLKNDEKIEYPMTEVFRFSLNNNVLTVILKDGKIERRSIFDIQKFSVE